MRKPSFCICENKDVQLISTFVFATKIIQSLYFLNMRFHLLWLYTAQFVSDRVRNSEDRFFMKRLKCRILPVKERSYRRLDCELLIVLFKLKLLISSDIKHLVLFSKFKSFM